MLRRRPAPTYRLVSDDRFIDFVQFEQKDDRSREERVLEFLRHRFIDLPEYRLSLLPHDQQRLVVGSYAVKFFSKDSPGFSGQAFDAPGVIQEHLGMKRERLTTNG